MLLLSFLVAATWVTTSFSAVVLPGPRTTTDDGNGHKYVESSETYGVDAIRYYGKSPLHLSRAGSYQPRADIR